MKSKKEVPNSGMQLKGFFRVNIEEDGKIVGDSGWCENQVTNLGIQNYIAYALLSNAASTPAINAAALGTTNAPASDGTTLPGEIMASTQRVSGTRLTTAFSSRSTSNGSATAQWTFTFYSSASFLTGASNISNIGLYNGSATNATLLCGNTYTSSSCNTNQNVNCTYQIRIG